MPALCPAQRARDKGDRPARVRRSRDGAPRRSPHGANHPGAAPVALTARRGWWPGAVRMSSGLAEPLPGGWYRSGHLPAAVLRPGSFPLFFVLPSRRPCRERCGLLPAAGECSLPLALRGAPAEGILASPRRLRGSPHGNRGLAARGSRWREAMSSRRSACRGLGLPQRGPLSALDKNGSVLFLSLNNGLVGVLFFLFFFISPSLTPRL